MKRQWPITECQIQQFSQRKSGGKERTLARFQPDSFWHTLAMTETTEDKIKWAISSKETSSEADTKEHCSAMKLANSCDSFAISFITPLRISFRGRAKWARRSRTTMPAKRLVKSAKCLDRRGYQKPMGSWTSSQICRKPWGLLCNPTFNTRFPKLSGLHWGSRNARLSTGILDLGGRHDPHRIY